ncbi:MAG: transposase [Chloroflexi bacterium]|nr:transposase [Chloroflexota bacterium]
MWEETNDENHKNSLVRYNREDCQATKLLADEIRKIGESAHLQPNIDYVDHPKQQATDMGNEIHSQFQAILRFAHAGYDTKKINFRDSKSGEKRKAGAPKGHPGYQRPIPSAQDVIPWDPRKVCPQCNSDLLPSDQTAEKTIIDLNFTENGCSRQIVKLKGLQGYCPKCRKHYKPESVHGLSLFGHGFQSWVVYQRLSLRLPYDGITQSLEEQFGEKVCFGLITQIIKRLGAFYAETENLLVQQILASPFVHVDETTINVQGAGFYAWVFTDGQHVVLRMTETRETTVVAEFLKGYKGILVSDFYGGYDAIECQQQKCLVHLIRDLNDDLWKFPFDGEYQEFVAEVKALLVPIIEMVHQYGLLREYLHVFRKQVELFYEKVILDRTYHSELTLKYQKRFKLFRANLFTFLDHDGIPWNNNMAERALRHLVIQENISRTFYKSVLPHHLLLMGIMQTCRFQNKSFLKFLVSQEKDVDGFRIEKSTSKGSGVLVPAKSGIGK